MSTKMVRLNVEAETVAKQYGNTVSDGIVEMNRLIHAMPTATSTTSACSTVYTAASFDQSYWDHIRSSALQHDKAFRTEPLPPKPTVAPVKIIGKIDPSEQLQEPIGRQGRDVR